MGRNALMVMVFLALLLGVGALLALRDPDTSPPAAGTALGQTLLPALKAADVARITIREPKATLTLEKMNDRWVISERGGFPADLDKVTELVVKVIELKVGQAEAIGAADRPRMLLAAPGAPEGAATALTFAGADGKALAELWLGKKYFKSAPDGDAGKAPGDGRFVMLPSDDKRVVLVSEPLRQASASPNDWVAREGVVIDNIKSLEVKGADIGYKVARALLDTPWQLDGKGGTLDQGRANAASYALAKLELEDVAAAGTDAGFEAGTEIIASTFDGLDYRIKVGRAEGARQYVQVQVQGEVSRVAPSGPVGEKPEDKAKREKAFAEQTKTFAERVAREKALAPHTVLVAKAKFAEVLKPRDALLVSDKKDAGKKSLQ